MGTSVVSRFDSGRFVRTRSTAWLVEGAKSVAGVDTLDLVSVEDDSQGDALTVVPKAEIDLTPIDTSDWSTQLRATFEDPARLGAHLKTTDWRTATAADRKLFQAPFRSGIRLDAYQLLPLAKALELPRVNLLIADDVGLGKTIEAGLIIRELMLRRRLDFVVVAAPASMMSQWQDELAQKFGLDFTIVDREHLLEARRTRGFSANPWSIGSRFIVSHSVLADDSYMTGLRDLLQTYRARSMFVLDEAHHAAPSGGLAWATESQLTRAVRDIAGPFEHRLFLSATPHNGHPNSFATLLDILDPQRFTRGIDVTPKELEPVMVRRLKEDLRKLGHAFPERIIEPIVIDNLPPDAPELQLADMLGAYQQGNMSGSRGRFLFANMQQRLFSSIRAFDRTLRTHLRTLERKQQAAAPDAAEDVNESDDLIEQATQHARSDVGDLQAAITYVKAMLAITDQHTHKPDARVHSLLAWIKREMLDGRHQWQDRRLIIFTEWDDTRRWLVDQLRDGLEELSNGKIDLDGRIVSFTGQTSLEERDRIKIAFNAPYDQEPIRILVCTDAAREGLNLQARCRDLIHFDLPWNPSRLEQRNGRIDRKLQPAAQVSCRYFFYKQRVEDRVLYALIRKTETIRQQLGTAGEVLRRSIESKLTEGGIGRQNAAKLAADIENATDARTERAKRDLDDDADRRLQRLKEEEGRLQRQLDQARDRVGVDGIDLRRIVEVALSENDATLQPGGFSVPEALLLDPASAGFQKDSSWSVLFDELRAGRPPKLKDRARWRQETPVRGLVFEPPHVAAGQPEPQDVVQVHLEHRLVKRLISRFASQGFRSNVGRVTAIVTAGAQSRVALLGRLSLFGPGARRLHEELIVVTAPWNDLRRDQQPLQPFGRAGETTTVSELEEALRKGRSPGAGIIERLQKTVDRDISDLRTHLEERATASETEAVQQLLETGRREADQLAELLRQQIARVRQAMNNTQPPAQFELDLRSDAQRDQAEREMKQFEADRRSWDGKLLRLQGDLEKEPERVVEGYGVIARQLEPIGLVYLWPQTN